MASQKTLEHYLRQLRLIEEHREKWCEENVRRHYKDLMKDLREFLGVEYAKLAVDDKLTYEILHRKGQYARFIEEVSTRMDKVCRKVGQEVKDTVHLTYQKCFEGMVDAVTKSKDYEALKVNLKGVRAITPDQVKNAVSNTFLEDALEKNHKESIYTIKQQVGVGLSQGDRMSTMAKRLSEQIDKDYNKSIRIVRTETHRVREAGFQDASMRIQEHLDEADSDYVVVKTWKTMKDGAVRPQRLKGKKGHKTIVIGRGPNHMKMHGVTVLVDEMFDLGAGAKAMTPGQSGVAGHDINCRCVLIRDLMTYEEYEKKTGKTLKKKVDSTTQPETSVEFMWNDDFTTAAQKSYTDKFNELSQMYPLDKVKIEVVGDTFEIRGWDRNLPDDKLREDIIYDKLGQMFGAQYMPKGMNVLPSKGAFIEIADNERTVISLDDWFKQMRDHRLKRGEPKTLADCFNNVAEGTEAVITHEYAHALADNYGFYGSAKDGKWLRDIFDKYDDFDIAKELSRYATTSPDEFFAECFVKSFDKYSDSKIAKEVMDEFRKRYKVTPQKVKKKKKVDPAAQYETQEKNLLDERVKYESEKEKLRQYQEKIRSKKYTDIFVDPVTPADYEAKKRNLTSARKKIQDKIDSVDDKTLDLLYDVTSDDFKAYNRLLRDRIGLDVKDKYDLRWTDLQKYKDDPDALKAYVKKQAAKYRDDLAKQLDKIDEFEQLGKEYVKYSKDIQRLNDRIKGVSDDLADVRKQIMKVKGINVKTMAADLDDLKKQLADKKKATTTLDPKWKKVTYKDDPDGTSVFDYLNDPDEREYIDEMLERAKARAARYPDEQAYKDRVKSYEDFLAQVKKAQDEMVDPKVKTLEKLIKGKQDELDDIVKRYELKVTGSYAPRTQSAKILNDLQAHADNNISKFNRTFDEIARANNLDVSVVRDELNKALGEIINDCDIGMRKSVGTIERLLKDPDNEYIKNLFETGGSGGCSNKSTRGGGEVSVFGYKTNLPNFSDDLAEDRPVYGMMIPKLDGSSQAVDYITNGPGSWYGGGVTIVIDKNKVFNNASFTLGDSLDYSHDLCGSTFDNPQFNGAWYNFKSASKNLLNPNKSSSEKLIETFTSGDKYMEVQIHGRENKGIDIVERVYFTTRNAYEDAQKRGLLDLLDQRNIPWEKLF